MTGETNQGMGEVQEIATSMETNVDMLPESLFGDDSFESDTTVSNESETNEAVTTEESSEVSTEVQEQTPAQTLKIKYNGKEEDISLEDAVILAQKGRNYDHVIAERDELRSIKSMLESAAKKNGTTIEGYIQKLNEDDARAERAAELKSLEEMYPDADEDVLKELAELKLEKSKREKAQLDADNEREAQEERVKPWREFMAAFPGVDVESLPKSVISEIHGGKSPVVAYHEHLNAELKREIEELKRDNQLAEQRGKNKALSAGSAVGDAAEKDKDDFLSGFFGT